MNYDDHLADDSARFVQALRTAQPGAQVPSCPEWDADDLLWHLATVQAFWARIVRDRITDGDEVRRGGEERPGDRAGLLAYFDQASGELRAALAEADDATPAWTWADDHSVGFIRRRQAHEALIHRVDAELTAGSRTPMDPALCADGVEEALRVMYGGAPDWGTFTPDDAATIRVTATDTKDSWLVALGRFRGTDPDGTVVDESDIRVLDGDPGQASASVEGTAADLDCWLWHRPTEGPVARVGDPEALSGLEAVLASPIN